MLVWVKFAGVLLAANGVDGATTPLLQTWLLKKELCEERPMMLR